MGGASEWPINVGRGEGGPSWFQQGSFKASFEGSIRTLDQGVFGFSKGHNNKNCVLGCIVLR